MISPAEADRRAWRLDGKLLVGASVLLFGWVSLLAVEEGPARSPMYVAGDFASIKVRATDRFSYRFEPAPADPLPEIPPVYIAVIPHVYAIADTRDEAATTAHVWLPALKPQN